MLYTIHFKLPTYNEIENTSLQSLDIEATNKDGAIEILKSLIPNISVTIAHPANERLFIEWDVTDVEDCANNLLSDEYLTAYENLTDEQKSDLRVRVLLDVIESHDCNNGVTFSDFEYTLREELDLITKDNDTFHF